MLKTNDLKEFQILIDKHEKRIGGILGIEPIRQRLFSDFNGTIKSLGAWGGDFVLAASNMNRTATVKYFNNRGYLTVFGFDELVFSQSEI